MELLRWRAGRWPRRCNTPSRLSGAATPFEQHLAGSPAEGSSSCSPDAAPSIEAASRFRTPPRAPTWLFCDKRSAKPPTHSPTRFASSALWRFKCTHARSAYVVIMNIRGGCTHAYGWMGKGCSRYLVPLCSTFHHLWAGWLWSSLPPSLVDSIDARAVLGTWYGRGRNLLYELSNQCVSHSERFFYLSFFSKHLNWNFMMGAQNQQSSTLQINGLVFAFNFEFIEIQKKYHNKL